MNVIHQYLAKRRLAKRIVFEWRLWKRKRVRIVEQERARKAYWKAVRQKRARDPLGGGV